VEIAASFFVVDVSGHGQDVSAVTQTLRRLMRENINVWDQADFMRGLNDAFNKSKKYATAIVLSFHRITGRLAFSNAGHLPSLWYHDAQRSWGWLEEENNPQLKKVAGLPVGLIPGTDYNQTVVTLKPSDLLVLYTDGITEAENGSSQELGRERLLDWARKAPVDSAKALGKDLLQRLKSFRGGLGNDDETLLVLRREQESRVVVLGEVASSYTFGRLRKSFKRD